MNTPLTGRKVLAIFVVGFGIIITVNLTLAFNAVRTFPGLETANSYVASQEFEAARAAQQGLGWTAEAHLTDAEVVLSLRDADGAPVGDAQINAILGRATNVSQDVTPDFAFDGTDWRAPVTMAGGNWDLRLRAFSADGISYQRRLKLRVVQ